MAIETINPLANGRASTWRPVGIVSILIPGCDDQVTQGQIARAVNAFAAARDLAWSNAFLQQIAAAILRAVQEYSRGTRAIAAGLEGIDTIQTRLHLAEQPAESDRAEKSLARWGFFLVHKRGFQPDLPQLFLEVYAYQE